MKILVTGGAGYIGSHTILELLGAGSEVTSLDNYVNSSPTSIERVEQITGSKVDLENVDVTDLPALEKVFLSGNFDAVIHFAALKAVGESTEKPLEYYQNNVGGLINVLSCMNKFNVKKIIFSSSATVYGDPKEVPITESSPVGQGITNPYGQSKYICEQILTDFGKANSDFSVTLLRYFNPVGAHESGLIGEDPNGKPNNLFPFITQVAVGRREHLEIFGDDYDTKDGTGVRDYIHVVDLAKGHLAALNHAKPGVHVYNLGTGKGYSVLEAVKAFESASGVQIPYKIVPRRPGDIAICYADPTKAEAELGWSAEKDLNDMCQDSWRWQKQNPNGYTA